jgi:hypothetical protein
MRTYITILAAVATSCAEAQSLKSVFTPNASVCVQFDAEGSVLAAAVDGRLDRKSINDQMTKLLRTRKWDPPGSTAVGKWIALSVAPDGTPVPELLPDCSHLPH